MINAAAALKPTARNTMCNVILDALIRLHSQRDTSYISMAYGCALGAINAGHSLSLITLEEASRLYDLANNAVTRARRGACHA